MAVSTELASSMNAPRPIPTVQARFVQLLKDRRLSLPRVSALATSLVHTS